MNILNLTIKKSPFDVMITGEKNFEMRSKSKWIYYRLFKRNGTPRQYDYVKFTNGYRKDSPWFIAEYRGFETIYHVDQIFSNGFHLKIDGEFWRIALGKVVETGNLKEGTQ